MNHITFDRLTAFIMRCLFGRVLYGLLSFMVIAVLWAGEPKASDKIPADLTGLSLQDLMDIEVTLASKKAQRFFDVTAAIFIITQEDIMRSGVTNIPEALRMVPGLQVARIDANKWAITSRGLNGRFANKLLVLIDGRSVYTPLFSGVFWDVQDTLLEDIDRIEVIRGPGAALWGANAVNGVINIITKTANETQGGLVSVGAGSEERGFGGLRYGGKIDEDVYYRVYAKYFNRDGFIDASGDDTADEWDVVRGGFRVDWDVSDIDSLTFQGDIYDGDTGQTETVGTLTPPFTRTFDDETEIVGGNVLARWQHAFSDSSEMALQLYYDRTERKGTLLGENRDTFDVDFQHQFALGKRQEIVWGLGYRFTGSETDNTFFNSFDPYSRDDDLFSIFVQDDISLIEERLRLTLGSKFEHNDYTGFEVQPSVRFLWKPRARHTAWMAISRAVRTPSRAEHDVRSNGTVFPPDALFPGSPPAMNSLFGSRDFDSEELLAYELGYRILATDKLSVDIATFYNDYDNLRTLEPGTPFLETSSSPPHLVIPTIGDNKMGGETYGVELAADWRVLDWWRLQAAYTYLQIQLNLDEDSRDTLSKSAEGESPHHQISFQSSMDLVKDLELDMWVRYVDDLPSQNVESYITLDARLGWKPHKKVELSIVGQNLLDSHHPEFKPEFLETLPTEIERGIYGKITLQF